VTEQLLQLPPAERWGHHPRRHELEARVVAYILYSSNGWFFAGHRETTRVGNFWGSLDEIEANATAAGPFRPRTRQTS